MLVTLRRRGVAEAATFPWMARVARCRPFRRVHLASRYLAHSAFIERCPTLLRIEGKAMRTAVFTVLNRLALEYPGISTRELQIRETNHFEQDLLIRGVRERDGAFLLATRSNDFVKDEEATVAEMTELAIEAIRNRGGSVDSIALSLRFEHSKAANNWAPNTLLGVMLVVG